AAHAVGHREQPERRLGAVRVLVVLPPSHVGAGRELDPHRSPPRADKARGVPRRTPRPPGDGRGADPPIPPIPLSRLGCGYPNDGFARSRGTPPSGNPPPPSCGNPTSCGNPPSSENPKSRKPAMSIGGNAMSGLPPPPW